MQIDLSGVPDVTTITHTIIEHKYALPVIKRAIGQSIGEERLRQIRARIEWHAEHSLDNHTIELQFLVSVPGRKTVVTDSLEALVGVLILEGEGHDARSV